MVQPQRAGSSCAIHRGVERPVQACPQALHNGACPRGEDCGMVGMLAFVSAALALTSLPPLPGSGLARETRVQLQTLGGRPIATVPGLDLAPDLTTAHGLVLRDRRGRLFAL